MWERAVGVRRTRCLPTRSRLSADGFGKLKLGLGPKALLLKFAQPNRRVGRTYRYCVGKRRSKGRAVAVFNGAGRTAFVASTARQNLTGGIHPGDRVAELARGARSIGGGLWVRRTGKGSTLVYGVKGGRVSFAGVTSTWRASPATCGSPGSARAQSRPTGRRSRR